MSEVLQGVVEENEYVLKFGKTYEFEGEKYDYIDLSGLEELSADDLIKAQKIMERQGSISVMPEMTLEYACIIAHLATKQPIEFFKSLPAKHAIKLKNKIMVFLNKED